VRAAGELLCDDQAVAWTGRPGDLARSLLRVGEWVLGVTTPVPELTVVRSAASGLAQRVGRILDGGRLASARDGRLALLLVVALGIGCSALPRVRLAPSLEIHIEITRSHYTAPSELTLLQGRK